MGGRLPSERALHSPRMTSFSMPSSSANFQTKSHVGKVEVERKQSGPSICSAPNAPADVPIALWSTRDSIEHVKKLLKLFKAEEEKKSSRDLGTAADACNGPCISSTPNAQAEAPNVYWRPDDIFSSASDDGQPTDAPLALNTGNGLPDVHGCPGRPPELSDHVVLAGSGNEVGQDVPVDHDKPSYSTSCHGLAQVEHSAVQQANSYKLENRVNGGPLVVPETSSSATFQTKSHSDKEEVHESIIETVVYVKMKMLKAEERLKSSRDLGAAADACEGPCSSSTPNARAVVPNVCGSPDDIFSSASDDGQPIDAPLAPNIGNGLLDVQGCLGRPPELSDHVALADSDDEAGLDVPEGPAKPSRRSKAKPSRTWPSCMVIKKGP